MENRSFDDLFSAYFKQQFSPSQTWGQAIDIVDPSKFLPAPNQKYTLKKTPLESALDPNHGHSDFASEYDNGANDGWPSEGGIGKGWTGTDSFAYVPTSETAPYAAFAENYGIGDHVFQANEGPSFPAHQYLISGQSGGFAGSSAPNLSIAENPPQHGQNDGYYPYDPPGAPAYCGGQPDLTTTINMQGSFANQSGAGDGGNSPLQPCFTNQYQTIFDKLVPVITPPAFTWEYIAHSADTLWAAPMAVNRFANYNNTSNPIPNFEVDADAYQFVTQTVPSGYLPALTYLTPCPNESDHPSNASSDGPQWVAWVINSIGKNTALWDQTAIFVVWDDWGGWYDHEVAAQNPQPNPYHNPSDPYEWGYRVPLLAVSAYTLPGTVDKTTRSDSSILDFVEWNFGAGSLGTDDTTGNNTDHLASFFNSTTPLAYNSVSTSFPTQQQLASLQSNSCP